MLLFSIGFSSSFLLQETTRVSLSPFLSLCLKATRLLLPVSSAASSYVRFSPLQRLISRYRSARFSPRKHYRARLLHGYVLAHRRLGPGQFYLCGSPKPNCCWGCVVCCCAFPDALHRPPAAWCCIPAATDVVEFVCNPFWLGDIPATSVSRLKEPSRATTRRFSPHNRPLVVLSIILGVQRCFRPLLT